MNLERLRNEIDRRGLKHRVLAEQIGMSPSAFSRSLAGKQPFEVNQFGKLIKILNIKFEALLQKAS